MPLSNCPLSPWNGQLSKLHVNKAQFYLRVQKENAQCLSKYIIFWLRCILSQKKSSYLDRYSDFLLYLMSSQLWGINWGLKMLSYSIVLLGLRVVIFTSRVSLDPATISIDCYTYISGTGGFNFYERK